MRTGELSRAINSLPIKRQLFLVVLCLAVFAAGIIIYSGVQERREVVANARLEMQSLATVIAVQQQGLVSSTEQLLSVLSRMPDLRRHDAASLAVTLGSIVKLQPEYSTIFVTDPAGEIWCSALPTGTRKIRDLESFSRAVANRGFTAGRYRRGQYSGRQILSFYHPYFDDAGQVSGVIILGVDLEYHRRLLRNFPMPPLANYILLDHDGVILSGGEGHDFAGQRLEAGAFSRMRDGPETDTFVGLAHDGLTRFISYRKVRLEGGQPPYLYVRAGVPVDTVMAQANRRLLLNLGVFMASLLVVFSLAWIVGTRSITDRVALLERSAMRVADGDLTVRVSDLVSGGELGSLGRSLDHMAQQLSLREEDLKKSRATIRQILDTLPQSIFWKDRGGVYLGCNAVFARAVGLRDPEQIAGMTDFDLPWTRAEAEACRRDDREVMASNRSKLHVVEPLQRADGAQCWTDTTKVPLLDGSGAVFGILGVHEDVTERKQAEERIRESEKQVREEHLKSQKLESIGTLAGGIAHDFNNLLQGIFGYISMAKLSLGAGDAALAMLEQAEKALHQSVNLTTQLLTFSKGGKPVKKRTALPPVIENAVKFALSGSRSEYRIEIQPDLWQVDADEGQLGQVIQNIVLNADQAMPRGGSVVITARNLPAADTAHPQPLRSRDSVVIAIADTGVGIAREDLARIFDPYFTKKEQGSGLGLATSYSIIRNHDGLIEVQSEPGKGSTFRVYLPASSAIGEEPPKTAAPAGTRAGRVLVMDDEALVRNVAGELLRALGHTPTFADKGETAIEAYRRARESGQPLDVVILDLTIRGGVGGEETLRRLREIDPSVKAVVSSGYSDDTSLANYRQQGFAAFLKKPYQIDELRNTLHALLT